MAIVLDISDSLPRSVDVVVLGLTGTDAPAVVGTPKAISKAWTATKVSADELAVQLGAKADVGAVSWLPPVDTTRLMVVGLGENPTPAEYRKAASAAVIAARKAKVVSIALALGAEEPETVRAVSEAAVIAAHPPHTLATDNTDGELHEVTVVAGSPDKKLAAEAQAVATAVAKVREWVNLPANLLYPETFADQAKRFVSGTKISVDILNDVDLAKGGYGGLTAVGGGSDRGPRLVRLSYAPRGAKVHVAFVGKGITFDSGGLDLKPADGMYTMRCDMAGAATVLAVTRAIADLGLKIKVTTYAAMAENMPSGSAYRPSDVLTMYGGTTVENANTDAEGRLVMADALARASEDSPDIIVDAATLTGACTVALGQDTAGVFSDDDALADRFLAASESASELVWRLPMTEEARRGLTSDVADVRSSGKTRYGGASGAAAFLRTFVPEQIAWAHLDIAGPAFRDSADCANPAGGTGFGVRTLIELARSLAS